MVYFIKNTLAFIRKGYFSEPQDGDYVTDSFKQKFPACTAPTKAEVEAAKALEAVNNREEEAGA